MVAKFSKLPLSKIKNTNIPNYKDRFELLGTVAAEPHSSLRAVVEKAENSKRLLETHWESTSFIPIKCRFSKSSMNMIMIQELNFV